jgi:hypothetical protein
MRSLRLVPHLESLIMKNAHRTSLVAFCVTAAACAAQAQNFTGPAAFTLGPSTQLGPPPANALVLTSTGNGFVAAGTVTVTVAPAPVAGSLAFWEIDRPFTLSTATTFVTTSSLDGLVAPPLGGFGPTGGTLRSYVIDTANNNAILPGTTSQIALSLINGATTWTMLSTNSPSFTLPAYNFYAVRQVFDLDGVYLGGPGGSWVVDVPAGSDVVPAPVPEPASYALMALGLAAFGLRRAAARCFRPPAAC